MSKHKTDDIIVSLELEFMALHFPGLHMGACGGLGGRASGESDEVPLVPCDESH